MSISIKGVRVDREDFPHLNRLPKIALMDLGADLKGIGNAKECLDTLFKMRAFQKSLESHSLKNAFYRSIGAVVLLGLTVSLLLAAPMLVAGVVAGAAVVTLLIFNSYNLKKLADVDFQEGFNLKYAALAVLPFLAPIVPWLEMGCQEKVEELVAIQEMKFLAKFYKDRDFYLQNWSFVKAKLADKISEYEKLAAAPVSKNEKGRAIYRKQLYERADSELSRAINFYSIFKVPSNWRI